MSLFSPKQSAFQKHRKTSKGFTLLEVIMGSIIFGVVIVSSFALYQYLIKLGAESRYIGDVKNYQSSTMDAIKGIVKIEGWERFVSKYGSDPNKSYALVPSIDNPLIYEMEEATVPKVIGDNNNSIHPYKWLFNFQVDNTLGPYISHIEKATKGYNMVFSKPILAPEHLRLDELFSCINNPSHTWDVSTYDIDNEIISIDTSGATPTIIPGDIIKPTRLITEDSDEEKGDITYTKGVCIPDGIPNCNANADPLACGCGYPQVIKTKITIVVEDVYYVTNYYIRYDEL